jgi:hypothetical protein
MGQLRRPFHRGSSHGRRTIIQGRCESIRVYETRIREKNWAQHLTDPPNNVPFLTNNGPYSRRLNV